MRLNLRRFVAAFFALSFVTSAGFAGVTEMPYGVWISENGKEVAIPKYDRMTVRENNYGRMTYLPEMKGATTLGIKMKKFNPEWLKLWSRTLDFDTKTEKVEFTVSDAGAADTFKVTLNNALPEGRILVIVYGGELENNGNVGGQWVGVVSGTDILPWIEKKYQEPAASLSANGKRATIKDALKAFPGSTKLKDLQRKLASEKA